MVDITGLKEMLKLHPNGTHFCTTSKESGFALNAEFLLKLISEYENQKKEIEILRLYGNKDCTAMADERLAEIDRDRK